VYTAFGIFSEYCVGWQPVDIYARSIPVAVYALPPVDEQVVRETCRGC
jgi:hypothetical protein